jgi:hypothetical protein
MFKTMGKTRLWRVEAIHVNGYTAPYSLIETDGNDREYEAEAKALKEAKLNSRLADFDCWNFHITRLHWTKRNGKWYK